MYQGDNPHQLRPTRNVNVAYPCDEHADWAVNADHYVPCKRPTDGRKFKNPHRSEGPYYFCDLHRDHNLRRGFEEVTDAAD